MKKAFTRNSNGEIEELKILEEKAKQQRLPLEEHRKIIWYMYSLRLISEEFYWNECV